MPRRRLTDAQVVEVKGRLEAGETLRVIAADYGVAWTTIRNVATRGYRGYRNQYTGGRREHLQAGEAT